MYVSCGKTGNGCEYGIPAFRIHCRKIVKFWIQSRIEFKTQSMKLNFHISPASDRSNCNVLKNLEILQFYSRLVAGPRPAFVKTKFREISIEKLAELNRHFSAFFLRFLPKASRNRRKISCTSWRIPKFAPFLRDSRNQTFFMHKNIGFRLKNSCIIRSSNRDQLKRFYGIIKISWRKIKKCELCDLLNHQLLLDLQRSIHFIGFRFTE